MHTREYVEQMDGTEFPGRTFEECILSPIFDIQKKHFYKAFIKISKAHAIMLFEQEIINREEIQKVLHGLQQIENINFKNKKYDSSYEDMFFMVESMLEKLVEPEAFGRIHIARSRNDIDICEFRMVLREKVLEVSAALNIFKEVLLRLIEENIETIMPVYTHIQPAQPSTLAHYLLAFYDATQRDYGRLMKLADTINKSPLGAAAVTTTGFPINRDRTRELLGFDELIENSYDCIAGCDYLTECAATLMVLNINMSRLMKDTLDFCTKEFNVFCLSDPYVQTSSIMPQKRNPSSLEHARPMISKAIGEAKCVFDILHNTPFGDIVDIGEQLQPHLYDSASYTIRVLKIISVVFATLKVNKEVLFKRAHDGFITVTELADVLVREKGLSFRQSHKIVSATVRHIIEHDLTTKDITSEMIASISEKVTGHKLEIDNKVIQLALDPVFFVNIRKITGGPAPEETTRMLNGRKKTFHEDKIKYEEYMEKFENANQALEQVAQEILSL